MKTMSESVKNGFVARINRVAAREESANHIFSVLCAEFVHDDSKKYDAEHMLYVNHIGSANSDERHKLKDAFFSNMDYVIYNGESKKTLVDVQEITESTEYSDSEKFVKEFRIGTEVRVLDKPARRGILEGAEMKKKVTITHRFESGYEKKVEVDDLDKDGKPIIVKRKVCYKFVPKSRFGYTKRVIEAFLDALEQVTE